MTEYDTNELKSTPIVCDNGSGMVKVRHLLSFKEGCYYFPQVFQDLKVMYKLVKRVMYKDHVSGTTFLGWFCW